MKIGVAGSLESNDALITITKSDKTEIVVENGVVYNRISNTNASRLDTLRLNFMNNLKHSATMVNFVNIESDARLLKTKINYNLDDAINSFINSPEHSQNILSNAYNYIGIGLEKSDNYGYVIVLMFIGK